MPQLCKRALESISLREGCTEELQPSGTRDQWLGLASQDSPLACWFEDLLEQEVTLRRRKDAAQRSKEWRASCPESLSGPARVAHRLIKAKRGEAAAAVRPNDPQGLAQVLKTLAMDCWCRPGRRPRWRRCLRCTGRLVSSRQTVTSHVRFGCVTPASCR